MVRSFCGLPCGTPCFATQIVVLAHRSLLGADPRAARPPPSRTGVILVSRPISRDWRSSASRRPRNSETDPENRRFQRREAVLLRSTAPVHHLGRKGSMMPPSSLGQETTVPCRQHGASVLYRCPRTDRIVVLAMRSWLDRRPCPISEFAKLLDTLGESGM